jgi:exodeoxyribonuclease V beta subunit
VRDRLCELDFEFPLTGGDRPDGEPAYLGDGPLLPPTCLPATRSRRAPGSRAVGEQACGYLSGSIDVVLRVPDG